MCELCDENGGEYLSCQDCGRLICFDITPDNIDVMDRAYVTSSGDLFCRRCGVQYDIEDEYDDEYGYDGDWEGEEYDYTEGNIGQDGEI